MDSVGELQELCGSYDRREIDCNQFVGRCTRLIASHIGCSRAGIWLFDTVREGHMLRCLGIFDKAAGRMTLAPDESSAHAAPYFEALERTGHVVAANAKLHPATAGFFAGSLAVNGVESLMATSFSVNGELFGAFTCTEVAKVHDWTPRQLLSLKRIAARASLSLGGASRVTLHSMFASL